MAEQMTGGCACGRVRFTAAVEPDEAYLCHCRMCQRATGSVSIAFSSAKLDGIDGTASPTGTTARRSPGGPICRECGTSLGFAFKEGSDKMDLTVAAFDDPSPFTPKHHFGAESIQRAVAQHRGPARAQDQRL